MKTKIFLVAAVLTAFFALSCEIPDDSSDKKSGKIPEELVAKWYISQALADAGTGTATIEFTAEGKLLYNGIDNQLTITVKNNVIANYRSGKKVGTVKYSISGTAINFSESTGEQILSTSLTFYKKGGTSGGGEEVVLGSSTSGDFQYEYTASTVIITGYTGAGGNVTIPETIDGKPVTAIKGGFYSYEAAFHSKSLTSVTIPNSVTSIGWRAFYNNQLTSVTIGNSVTSIGDSAFYNNQLTSVIIPNSVISIGDDAFYHNQLTSVTIGNSVISIGDYAFAGSNTNSLDNNQLTSIIIPNSVTSIGRHAFSTNKLNSVTIGNSVRTIGEHAFDNNQLTSIIIPNSVTSIGESAFFSNQLISITIGANVTLHVDDNTSLDSFDNGFGTTYDNGGKLAGTYTRPNTSNTTWTRQ